MKNFLTKIIIIYIFYGIFNMTLWSKDIKMTEYFITLLIENNIKILIYNYIKLSEKEKLKNKLIIRYLHVKDNINKKRIYYLKLLNIEFQKLNIIIESIIIMKEIEFLFNKLYIQKKEKLNKSIRISQFFLKNFLYDNNTKKIIYLLNKILFLYNNFKPKLIINQKVNEKLDNRFNSLISKYYLIKKNLKKDK